MTQSRANACSSSDGASGIMAMKLLMLRTTGLMTGIARGVRERREVLPVPRRDLDLVELKGLIEAATGISMKTEAASRQLHASGLRRRHHGVHALARGGDEVHGVDTQRTGNLPHDSHRRNAASAFDLSQHRATDARPLGKVLQRQTDVAAHPLEIFADVGRPFVFGRCRGCAPAVRLAVPVRSVSHMQHHPPPSLAMPPTYLRDGAARTNKKCIRYTQTRKGAAWPLFPYSLADDACA